MERKLFMMQLNAIIFAQLEPRSLANIAPFEKMQTYYEGDGGTGHRGGKDGH
jgi:hypothetical protein